MNGNQTRHLCTLAVLAFLTASAGVAATQPSVVVQPTLIEAMTQKRVTATAVDGDKFYTGTTAPVFRVRLYQNGVAASDPLTPTKVTQTQIDFMFPPLPAGYYGFIVRYQNPSTGLWAIGYESSPTFFRVASNAAATMVYIGSIPTLPLSEIQHSEFLPTVPPIEVKGWITGSYSVAHSLDDGPDVLSLRKYSEFYGNPEGDPAGVSVGIDCLLDGYTTYHYAIPFALTIDFPAIAYQAQTIKFTARDFRFINEPNSNPALAYVPSIRVEHGFTYSARHRLYANAPYDLIPPLEITLLQARDHLEIGGKLPLAPLVDMDLGWVPDIGGPFSDGEISADEFAGGLTPGVHRLGGNVAFTNSLASQTVHPDGTMTATSGMSQLTDLWTISGDQIRILSMIPLGYVQAAAAVLTTAGVRLDQTFGMSLKSEDTMLTKPPYLYDFSVQAPLMPAESQPVHFDITFPVDTMLVSRFLYELTAGFTFDMPYKDPLLLMKWNLQDVYGRLFDHREHTATASFSFDTTIQVLSLPQYSLRFFPNTTGDIVAVNYTVNEASYARARIDGIVLDPPALPEMAPSLVETTEPVFPDDAIALVIFPAEGGRGRASADPQPVDGRYAKGTLVTVTADAEPGFRFAGWGGDLAGAANPATVTMDAVRQVRPLFEPAWQALWLGWLVGGANGWTYHAEHGWEFPNWTGNTSLFMFDQLLGCWLWTSETAYPYLYKYGANPGWHWYYRGATPGKRWFYSYAAGKWLAEAQMVTPP